MRYFLVIFITVFYSLQAVGQQNISPVQVKGNDKTGIVLGDEVADSTIKKGVINLLHIYKESKPNTTVQRFETVQQKMVGRIFTWIDITFPVYVFKTDKANTNHVVSYLPEKTGKYFKAHVSDSLLKSQFRATRLLNQERPKP